MDVLASTSLTQKQQSDSAAPLKTFHSSSGKMPENLSPYSMLFPINFLWKKLSQWSVVRSQPDE
jgi:hypothetical protein